MAAKKRVTIVGGGMAGLAAAYELSATEALRARYAIRIVTLGWRLGGKCASSRNQAHRWRNEEHGLHILGGFYHNTFAILNALYRDWAAVSPNAIAFADAFAPHDQFTVMERRRTGWRPVTVHFPRTSGSPGVNPHPLSLAQALRHLLLWTSGLVDQATSATAIEGSEIASTSDAARHAGEITTTLHKLAHSAEMLADPAVTDVDRKDAVALLASAQHRLEGALSLALAVEVAPETAATTLGLERYVWAPQTMPMVTTENLQTRATPGIGGADWIALAGLAIAVVRGLIGDRVSARGFDSLNDLDATAWLASHGASKRVQRSCFVQSGYHYAFAFRDGDPERPDFAAGVALRGLLRMFFTYEGSVFVHVRGGMGEIVVAPFYEVLKSRGVQFAFFHKVTQITPAGDGATIARICGRRQARVSAGDGAYLPLVSHRGRRCWPVAPLFDQLDAPHAPPSEDEWSFGGDGVDEFVLEAGRDFDIAIVAVPPAVLKTVAQPLTAHSPRWALMLDNSATTPTIGAQIWYDAPIIGEPYGGIATAYAAPLSTWADMSFLTGFEDPPAGSQTTALSYFCGPAQSGTADAATQTQNWLNAYATTLLPGLFDPHTKPREIERFARLNASSTDLYVLSPAGAIAARLQTDDTGYGNLLVAGDWIKSGADVGAVEAAVMAGRQAARAISGSPDLIWGERDFE